MPSTTSQQKHRETGRDLAFDAGGDLLQEKDAPPSERGRLVALLADPAKTLTDFSEQQLEALRAEGAKQKRFPELAAICREKRPDLERVLALVREALKA